MSKTELMEQHLHVLGLKTSTSDAVGLHSGRHGIFRPGEVNFDPAINRLIEPTAGEVLVDGVDVVR